MMTRLPRLCPLAAAYELPNHKQPADLDLQAPALPLMQDFRLHHAVSVLPDTPADEALHLLTNSRLPVLMVVDHQGHFTGVVSEHSLSEAAIIRKVSQHQRRKDLQVRDLLISRHQLHSLSLADVEGTTIGRIITLLERENLPFVLVTDDTTTAIAGVFCATELTEVFGLSLNPRHSASFTDLVSAVAT